MYQCHTFIYSILMVCVYLVRSNTEFTRFLSPFLRTEVFSRYGTNLTGICFRYDVGRIDWYPVANIKHGWIEESLSGIIRNLLTDIHNVRVVQSEARWRLVASDKLFVATRDGFWGDQRSSWSDHLIFILNNRSIILVQLISHYFTIDVTWWFEKKWVKTSRYENCAYVPAFWSNNLVPRVFRLPTRGSGRRSNCIKISLAVIKRKNMFFHWIKYFQCSVSVIPWACLSKVPKRFGCHNSLYVFAAPTEVVSHQTSQSSWCFFGLKTC